MISNAVKNIIFGGLYGSGTPAGNYLGNELQGLSIDFAQNSALVRGHTTNFIGIPQSLLTVTRASSATYFDASGIQQTASSNILRLDYDPVTHAGLGVLREGQRTNLQLQSTFASGYTVNAGALTANAATGVDGTSNAATFVPTAANASHYLFYTAGWNGTAATYTASVFVKKTGSTNYYINLSPMNSDTVATGAVFDVSAGTVVQVGSANISATITPVANGFYRIAVSFTATAANFNAVLYLVAGTSTRILTTDGSSGWSVVGWQIELGAFATSYIPTTSAQVTRAADAISLATTAFPLSATADTVVFEGQHHADASNYAFLWSLDDGTVNERRGNYATAVTNAVNGYVVDGGSAVVDVGDGAVAVDTSFKTAIACAANDWAMSRDGRTVVTDATLTLPTVTSLKLGGNYDQSSALSGHIKKFKYIPRRCTNAELQAFSA